MRIETIFDAPNGARVTFYNVEVFNDTGARFFVPEIQATTTNKIKYSAGAWRRLCIYTSVETAPGCFDIWMGTPKEMRNPDEQKALSDRGRDLNLSKSLAPGQKQRQGLLSDVDDVPSRPESIRSDRYQA